LRPRFVPAVILTDGSTLNTTGNLTTPSTNPTIPPLNPTTNPEKKFSNSNEFQQADIQSDYFV